MCLAFAALTCAPAGAQAVASLGQLSLVRTEDGLYLNATVDYEPATAVADAVSRSVPLYFVAHAEVMRERWYWTDARVAQISRTYRVAYQPLTRRWRVSVASGSGPAGNLQYALHQNHDSLRQAIASVTRVYGWKVAEAEALRQDADQYLNFQFKLDMALLPRPFQLGLGAQSDWSLDLRRTVSVPSQVTAAPVTPATNPEISGDDAPAPGVRSQ